MPANAEIKKLRNDIVDTLNNAPLPSEVKRLVLFEIYSEVKQVADTQITKEESEVESNGNTETVCEN